MTHSDFARAMLDNPDDDVVRLVFADWLDERGEADRAAWVRASCIDGQPDLVEQLWEQCKPIYWKSLGPQIGVTSDRGQVRFLLRRPPDLRRFGGNRWLPQAAKDGWVGRVRVQCGSGYDLITDAIRTTWDKQARGLPLSVDYIGNPGMNNLNQVLELPDLHDLGIPVEYFDT